MQERPSPDVLKSDCQVTSLPSFGLADSKIVVGEPTEPCGCRLPAFIASLSGTLITSHECPFTSPVTPYRALQGASTMQRGGVATVLWIKYIST